MQKKLNSLEDLSKIKFESLEPDREITQKEKSQFTAQELEAHFSNKGRGGKVVTIIKGFDGNKTDLKKLSKKLKNRISVGGTVKDGDIIIQGNHRDKIMDILQEMGHKVKRVGG